MNAFSRRELVRKLPLRLWRSSLPSSPKAPTLPPAYTWHERSFARTLPTNFKCSADGVAHRNHDPLLDKLPRCIQKHGGFREVPGKQVVSASLKHGAVNRSAMPRVASSAQLIDCLFPSSLILRLITPLSISLLFPLHTNLISTDHLFIVGAINDYGQALICLRRPKIVAVEMKQRNIGCPRNDFPNFRFIKRSIIRALIR